MSGLVVCCGLATLDVLQEVEAIPGPNQKVVASHLDVTFGGPAANAAATVVALGGRARLVTGVGTGPAAALVRGGLAGAGVELVDLAPPGGSPAVSSVLATRGTGERAVVSVNATRTTLGVPDARALDGAAVLLVDGHHLGAAVPLARAARERGIPVVLDGGSWKPGLEELLALVDHAVLSQDLTLPPPAGRAPAAGGDDVLDGVAALGPSFVARSAGADPIRWLAAGPSGDRAAGGVPAPASRRGELAPPVVPRHEVVDTLGAGDVLHGAYAHRVACGDAPVAALAAASAVASASVRHRGAHGWFEDTAAGEAATERTPTTA